MADHSFSDRALAMLDSMWATDTYMLVMRRRLHTLTGINYTPEEVRDAATRYQPPVVVEPSRPAWRLERELPGGGGGEGAACEAEKFSGACWWVFDAETQIGY